MQEELGQFKLDSLSLCDQLLAVLENNQEDAHLFFAGEVYQAYDAATEKAIIKVKQIKTKIRGLQ